MDDRFTQTTYLGRLTAGRGPGRLVRLDDLRAKRLRDELPMLRRLAKQEGDEAVSTELARRSLPPACESCGLGRVRIWPSGKIVCAECGAVLADPSRLDDDDDAPTSEERIAR